MESPNKVKVFLTLYSLAWALAIFLFVMFGCGVDSRAGGGYSVITLNAPDGSPCYVIVSGSGNPVGANCVK